MNASSGSAGRIERRAALWAVLMAGCACWLGVLASRGLRVETSVLAMLPLDERAPALHALAQQLSGDASRTLLILVGAAQPDVAAQGAELVERELRASADFTNVRGALDAGLESAFAALYFPQRYGLLSRELRAELEAGAGPAELLRRLQRLLNSPASALYTHMLEQDPLLVHVARLEQWSRDHASSGLVGASGSRGFVMLRDGELTHALLVARTASDPFDADGQRSSLAAVERARAELERRVPGAQLRYTGAPRFAASSRDAMQRDIFVVGTCSMIGSALIVLAAFRSLRPFALSFLPVACGTLAATLVCFVVFEHVHLLTLVFGTSLTGLGVDYALHYFAEHRSAGAAWDARAGMRAILPGITLGALTSVLGFSGLYFTAFPVLRQFALFASIGLVGAWATVVCWLPPLLRAPTRARGESWLHARCAAFLAAWSSLRARRGARAWLALLCLAALGGALLVRFDDDVRRFYTAPPELLEDDAAVRTIAGGTEAGRFVLVEGANEQQVLERLEQLDAPLRAAAAAHVIESSRNLADFLPSEKRQADDRALLERRLLPRFDELAAGLVEIGVDDAVIAGLRADLETHGARPLELATWLASPASEGLRALWLGPTAAGFGSVVLLGTVRDPGALERALAGRDGVHYVDTVRDMSRLLERYRVHSTRLVALAYGLVLLALCVRFGWRGGVLVMSPSLLSAALTLGALAATGTPLHVFHLLGLLLVLGLAVDYGVIFAEHGSSEATALFAVLLSVLTTVASFGLMATCSAPPLRALGISVSLGLVLALLLSPLSSLARPSNPARRAESARGDERVRSTIR